jgi:hypothetical protein
LAVITHTWSQCSNRDLANGLYLHILFEDIELYSSRLLLKVQSSWSVEYEDVYG